MTPTGTASAARCPIRGLPAARAGLFSPVIQVTDASSTSAVATVHLTFEDPEAEFSEVTEWLIPLLEMLEDRCITACALGWRREDAPVG